MAVESLYPDAILTLTGLTGAVTDIDEDPDSPDANWLTSTGSNGELRTSFPSPSGDLDAGANLQEFRLWLRKDASGGGDPTAAVELWENGALVSTLIASTAITSPTGEIVAVNWSASSLAAISGANVEIRLVFSKGGGGPNERNVEVGAVEWNADVAGAGVSGTGAAPLPALSASGAGTVSGEGPVGFPSFIGTPAKTTWGTNQTNPTLNQPGALAGEGILAVVSAHEGGSVTDITTSSTGWNRLDLEDNTADTSSVIGAVFYKADAAGDATDDLAITLNAAEHGSAIIQRITGQDPTVTLPDIVAAQGLSGNVDPPNNAPAAGLAKWLYVALAGLRTDAAFTAGPAGYTGFAEQAGDTSGSGVAIASLQKEASSEDPGAFTNGSEEWVAWNVAIPPASTGPTGTGAAPMPALSASGAGEVLVAGTGAATMPALSASGIGEVDVVGTGVVALPALSASGAGTVYVQGLGAAPLPALSASGAGTVGATGITGSGVAALPALATSGAGVVEVRGLGAAALPALSASGVGVVEITGVGVAALPALATSGVGVVHIEGVGAVPIPALAASGAGVVVAAGASGTGAVALPVLTADGLGVVLVSGTGTVSLPALLAEGTETQDVAGGGISLTLVLGL